MTYMTENLHVHSYFLLYLFDKNSLTDFTVKKTIIYKYFTSSYLFITFYVHIMDQCPNLFCSWNASSAEGAVRPSKKTALASG